MHDAKGRPLNVGDTVLIPCKVLRVMPGDYCALDVETLAVMPGNGTKNSIGALNAKQVLRANAGDDTQFDVVEDNGKTILK